MIMPSFTKEVVGVLGGKGMLGSDLVKFLSDRYETHSIDRANYNEYSGRRFDVLVNANGNSRRFWANENPAADFELSVSSVARSLFDFKYSHYIYISSPDIYADPGSPATTREHSPGRFLALSSYGFHKRLSEELVQRYAESFLILRSAALLGTQLRKGVVFDIVQGNALFVMLDSRLQFMTTVAIADIIKTLLEKKVTGEIFNTGGVGAVTPKEIGELAEKPVRVRDDAARQQYEMNTEKIRSVYGALQTSEEYVKAFMRTQRMV